jgi:hypothetical protein
MPSPGGVLRKLHIPWPAADEGSLREASAAWANLADIIRDNHGRTNSVAASLTSNNHGQAIDAFENYWSTYGGKNGLLPRGAVACEAMAKATSRYADAVGDAKRKIEEAGAEVAATLVVGTVGAIFTFGIVEGATVEMAAAWLTDAVEGIIAGFADMTAGIVSDALYTLAEAVTSEVGQSIVAAGIVGASTGTGGTILADNARDAVRQLFGQEPLSDSEAAKDIFLYGAVGGAASGSLAKIGELTGSQLSALLTDGSITVRAQDPKLATEMAGLAKLLYGTSGKISAGILATATSQLMTAQQIDSQGIISDQLQDYLLRAAEGGD